MVEIHNLRLYKDERTRYITKWFTDNILNVRHSVVKKKKAKHESFPFHTIGHQLLLSGKLSQTNYIAMGLVTNFCLRFVAKCRVEQ